jgi:hypothetical protein
MQANGNALTIGSDAFGHCPESNRIGARLCAKHQPQHVEKLYGIRRIPAGWFCEAAAAGLRHSRAPGAVRGCAHWFGLCNQALTTTSVTQQ